MSEIVLPDNFLPIAPPKGYEQQPSGLYAPAEVALPVVVCGEAATRQSPEDCRRSGIDKPEYDPDYLWSDPSAALNRLIAEGGTITSRK